MSPKGQANEQRINEERATILRATGQPVQQPAAVNWPGASPPFCPARRLPALPADRPLPSLGQIPAPATRLPKGDDGNLRHCMVGGRSR